MTVHVSTMTEARLIKQWHFLEKDDNIHQAGRSMTKNASEEHSQSDLSPHENERESAGKNLAHELNRKVKKGAVVT